MAPAFLSSAAFLLPFLANLMFLMNLASQPRRDSVLFLEGFLTPLRWAFLFWLWLVWFLDLAIFGGYLLILGICKFDLRPPPQTSSRPSSRRWTAMARAPLTLTSFWSRWSCGSGRRRRARTRTSSGTASASTTSTATTTLITPSSRGPLRAATPTPRSRSGRSRPSSPTPTKTETPKLISTNGACGAAAAPPSTTRNVPAYKDNRV